MPLSVLLSCLSSYLQQNMRSTYFLSCTCLRSLTLTRVDVHNLRVGHSERLSVVVVVVIVVVAVGVEAVAHIAWQISL